MRYWVFENNQLQGPYDPAHVRGLPNFAPHLKVCQEGDDVWQEARTIPAIMPASMTGAAAKPAPVVQSGDYVSARTSTPSRAAVRINTIAASYPTAAARPSSVKPPANSWLAAFKAAWTPDQRPMWALFAMALLWFFFFGLYMVRMDDVDRIIDTYVDNAVALPVRAHLRAWNPGARAKRWAQTLAQESAAKAAAKPVPKAVTPTKTRSSKQLMTAKTLTKAAPR